jgi:hypothetical protein
MPANVGDGVGGASVGCGLGEGVGAAVAVGVGAVVGVADCEGELVTAGAPAEHAVRITKVSPPARNCGFIDLVPLDRFGTARFCVLPVQRQYVRQFADLGLQDRPEGVPALTEPCQPIAVCLWLSVD